MDLRKTIFIAAFGFIFPLPVALAADLALEREVDAAIDLGVDYLLRAVEGPAGWCPEEKFPSGYAALQVYALVKGDVSYTHPVVQKGLAILEDAKLEKVYSVSLQLMAWGAIVEQIDADARLGGTRPADDRSRYLDRMSKALSWLISARLHGRGAWNYEPLEGRDNPRTHRWDNSNTQFAVLALGVAAKEKLRVPSDLWEEVTTHFIENQVKTGPETPARPVFKEPEDPGKGEKPVLKASGKAGAGGKTVARRSAPLYAGEGIRVEARAWRYTGEEFDPPSFSMCCAGLSSLLLAQKHLPAASLTGQRGEALKRAIRDGYGWLGAHFAAQRNPFQKLFGLQYDLYSLEKVGDLGEVASFGEFDWYAQGARRLLRLQRRDGSWVGTQQDEEVTRHCTALALLFLSRATDLEARSRPLVRFTSAGGAPPRGPEAGVYWLHLPSQKADVPLVRLLRLFAYRPSKAVGRMVEEAVKVCDPERVHELVRALARAAERSPFEPVKAQARKLLADATGVEGLDAARSLEWADRFQEVVRIGKAQEASEADRLREWLRLSEGTPLRARILWALERTGAKDALPVVIDLLESPDPALRAAAHSTAVFLSGKSLPFDPKGPEKARAEQVRAWREQAGK